MNYLIMKNESTLIGLFQGMFENNILTFNPGWNTNAEHLDTFDDIRTIQEELKSSLFQVNYSVLPFCLSKHFKVLYCRLIKTINQLPPLICYVIVIWFTFR